MKDAAGNEIDAPAAGESISAHTTVQYTGTEPVKLLFTVAQYNKAGALIDAKCMTQTMNRGEKTYSLENVEIQQATAKVRCFLWEQQSMRPIPVIK